MMTGAPELLCALLGCLVLGVLFLLPTIIGVARQVEGLGTLIALNFAGGLTLVGWPAAMILATMMPSTRPPAQLAIPVIEPYRQGGPHPDDELWLIHMLYAGTAGTPFTLSQLAGTPIASGLRSRLPPLALRPKADTPPIDYPAH